MSNADDFFKTCTQFRRKLDRLMEQEDDQNAIMFCLTIALAETCVHLAEEDMVEDQLEQCVRTLKRVTRELAEG